MTKRKKSKSQREEELLTKLEEVEENWKRALADYQNLEKRIKQKQKTITLLANIPLIDKLFGVVDGLQRAAQHLNDPGLSLVLNQLESVLESEGVEEIKTLQEKFDPETMDCVGMVQGPKNKVIKVQLKGYKLNDHVIRPAKVEVGKGSKKK